MGVWPEGGGLARGWGSGLRVVVWSQGGGLVSGWGVWSQHGVSVEGGGRRWGGAGSQTCTLQ